MDEMSIADIKRDYVGCLIMYKGAPCVFTEIGNNMEAVLYSIEHESFMVVPFSIRTITSNIGRIGLVNTFGAATAITRIPKRTYYIGLRHENTRFACLNRCNTDRAELEYDQLMSFKHKGIAEAIHNTYPPLAEALVRAKKEKGCCAFDKQFAVHATGTVYFYTGEIVGEVREGKIVLSDAFKFLGSLLGNYHEKTSRAFKAAPEKR